MKFLLRAAFLLAALLPFSCSEYDDSDILDRLDNLEGRVSVLEKMANSLNEDVTALKTTLAAIAAEDVVVSIRAIDENGKSGFEVTYKNSGTVKIFITDGGTALGAKAQGGVLYWTWNGEFLHDSNGKLIPVASIQGTNGVDGITPKFKIEDGFWYVSYSNGVFWEKLGEAIDYSVFKSAIVKDGKLMIVLSDGTVLTIPIESMQVPEYFDENSIVLSIAAISDVHIGNSYGSENKFSNALTQLKFKAAEKDANGLDAVIIAGDLVNTVNSGQISTLKTLYENVFDPTKVPMIYTVGNHDMNPGCKWSASTVSQNAVFHTVLGDNYFLTDQDQNARKSFECRHCVVGNYHILCVTPNGSDPVVYDAQALTWLNAQLKAITEADPNHYVLVVTHPMIHDTVYGSDLGTYWYTSSLTSILDGYPQAVTFSGHLHFPLNDPRSIWQGKFTSLGCASVSYMAFEGGDYINKKSETVLNDADQFSQGLLLQFDANGGMRITRMDFYHPSVIGQPWEIKAPKSDGSHLEKYNHSALRAANTPPVLSNIKLNVGALSDGKAPVSVDFDAATDDEFVHHYCLSIKKGETVVASRNFIADFYSHPQPSQMADAFTISFGNVDEGDYTVSVVAYDSWGAASTPLVKELTIGSETKTAFWTNDSAGSMAVYGGNGTIDGDWLHYTNGTLSWTDNTTGSPRKCGFSLPNGNTVTVTQLEASDFKGGWTLKSSRFALRGGYKTREASASDDLVFGDPLSTEALPRTGGGTITNNLGITGFGANLVMDAVVLIDYNARSASLGLMFDGRKAQQITTGELSGSYGAILPELGSSGWDSKTYEFGRTQIGSPNYDWLWMDVSIEANGKVSAQYLPFKQRINVPHAYTNDYILGIEVMNFTSEEVSDATLVRGSQTFTTVSGQTNSADYLAIYQANYGTTDANGMTFTKK